MSDSSVCRVSQRQRFARLPHLVLALSLLASSWMVSSGASLPAVANNTEAAQQRSLELQAVQGSVTLTGLQTGRGKAGDRLRAGQRLVTGKKSSAIIALDSQIGIIKVAENTDLLIRRLDVVANGGNVTLVSVSRGQVALRIRPFTNPASHLEIRTPSGIAGVRGTEFGVGVSPTGRTAVLTAEGKVAASAQGQTVLVQGGYSSLIYPGEPPTPPRPTVESVTLTVKTLQHYRSGLIRFIGQVDPINAVFYRNQPIEVGRDGRFGLEVLASQSNYLRLLVRTPLGREKEHIIQVP